MRITRLLLATAVAVPAILPAGVGAQPLPAPAAPPSAPSAAPGNTGSPAPAPLPNAPVSFAPLARQLLPAVVNISSTQSLQASRSGPPGEAPETPQAPPGSPFEQFFRDFLERNRRGGPGGPGGGAPGQQGENQPPRRGQSLGSGFIIDTSGIVVTNNHVINGADEINVILHDNTTIRAELIGTDERTDIAVLRIKTDHPLQAVPFGNSDNSQVGDWVMAIGNPFGLGGSVTTGIVSARGRDIRQGLYDDFIQTDAAINRGNSGGPLFNMQGQVIGINTAIYSPSGGSIGIGFAIPSNLASNIVAQLRDGGRVRRGWLGVNIQQVTDDIAESLGLKDNHGHGALVARAMDDGPAAKAGIQNGDVILRFDGHDVAEMRSLPRIVAETPVGKQVPVVVWRNGHEQTVQVTVAELPNDAQLASTGGAAQQPQAQRPVELSGLGMSVTAITPEQRDRYSLRPEQKGVVITDVAPNGAAADRDLHAGDVIVEVQQQAVATPNDVQNRLEQLRKQNRGTALLLIEGQGGQRWVPLRLRGGSGNPG